MATLSDYSPFDIGKGYCVGDGYLYPMTKEGLVFCLINRDQIIYCPVCGSRMRSRARAVRGYKKLLMNNVESRPLIELVVRG